MKKTLGRDVEKHELLTLIDALSIPWILSKIIPKKSRLLNADTIEQPNQTTQRPVFFLIDLCA